MIPRWIPKKHALPLRIALDMIELPVSVIMVMTIPLKRIVALNNLIDKMEQNDEGRGRHIGWKIPSSIIKARARRWKTI